MSEPTKGPFEPDPDAPGHTHETGGAWYLVRWPAVAASTGTSEDVEALVAWLVEQGGSPGSSLHSWRCEHPGRYGECDCLAESARDLLASDWLAAHDAATADRVRREGAALVRDDIQARRREFRRLNADQQYLNALDDAYGLAANRAREQAR